VLNLARIELTEPPRQPLVAGRFEGAAIQDEAD